MFIYLHGTQECTSKPRETFIEAVPIGQSSYNECTFSIIITELKAGQVRCGEHSDYGSITLLFQDGVGGLEVSA